MASRAKTIRVASPPEGFLYAKNLITPDEEDVLVRPIEKLPLKEFEFYGYVGKRRTISFGWHYDFAGGQLSEARTIPDFLLPLREKASIFAGREPSEYPHVLVTEYTPGTPIGWHRDKEVFEDVIGVSLVTSCTFRFRRRTREGWERHAVILDPRSVYLLRGSVRTQWEHSIPEVTALRYSVTFRSLRRSDN